VACDPPFIVLDFGKGFPRVNGERIDDVLVVKLPSRLTQPSCP